MFNFVDILMVIAFTVSLAVAGASRTDKFLFGGIIAAALSLVVGGIFSYLVSGGRL